VTSAGAGRHTASRHTASRPTGLLPIAVASSSRVWGSSPWRRPGGLGDFACLSARARVPPKPYDSIAGCDTLWWTRRADRRPRKAAMTIARYATYTASWSGVGESL
jgi:hypothetical protein